MNSAEVITAVRDLIEADWDGVTVPVYWKNERGSATLTPPFMHVTVRFGASAIRGLGGFGSNLQRQSGEVVMRIFDAARYGEDRLAGYADTAAAIFRTYTAGPLRFYDASRQGEGVEDGNLYEVDVIANFEFDLIG